MLTSRRPPYRRLLRAAAALRPPHPGSLFHAQRHAVVKRLGLAIFCCGTLAAVGWLPVSGGHHTPSTTTTAAAAMDRDAARVSRGEKRTAPSASSSVGSSSAAPAPATSAPPAKPAAPAAPATPATPVISGLDQYQAENAQTIVTVGTQMGVSTRGKVIAIATAMQESKLYNLYTAVDYDSLGLFQQRPSTGWGSPDELTTPAYAAHAFYSVLLNTQSDWGCLSCAAQRVQGSAFPYAYAQWEGFADSVVSALGG